MCETYPKLQCPWGKVRRCRWSRYWRHDERTPPRRKSPPPWPQWANLWWRSTRRRWVGWVWARTRWPTSAPDKTRVSRRNNCRKMCGENAFVRFKNVKNIRPVSRLNHKIQYTLDVRRFGSANFLDGQVYGHVARLPAEDPTHRILYCRDPRGSTMLRGRPRASWLMVSV